MKNLNKKSYFNTKVKTKSLTILLVTFLLSALVGTQLIGKVSAAIPYTQYEGTLDGADWALRIPDPWNGMLVLLCRGLSAAIPNPVTTVNNQGRVHLDQGFAVAASNYGTAGFAVQEGVESTYQLTMFLIDNYDITGRIFLIGRSMGGGIALLLGEKYPDVYSGVLDAFGIKDIKNLQETSSRWMSMSDEELEADLTSLGITRIPPDWFLSLQAFRDFHTYAQNSTENALGGTPEEVPEAYEAVSPTCHANIQIPVITVHGTDDSLVLYYQSLMYQTAVANAYRSSFYRLYLVPGGGHAGLFGVSEEVFTRFSELVEWSNELTGSSDWPMFGHDPERSAYSTSNAPNTNQTLWTNMVGVGSGSHPAVVDGKVYVIGWDGKLYCFDAATGAGIWNYTTGSIILCHPAVADGRVYLGSSDTNIYCINALTGAKIWSYKTGGNAQGAPVVVGNKVYMGSEDNKLYCLRADWGQVEWAFTAGGAMRFYAVADGKVYAGSMDNKVYCVGAATGALIWSYTTGDEVASCPTVANGRVYVGSSDDKVYCLDAATGAKIWSYTTGGDVYSSPAVAYGKVYVGSMDNNVYCLDPSTGALIWNYTTGAGVYFAPSVADGKVYVGSMDRNVYCLDAATGAFIWSYTANASFISSPVVANGVAYAVNSAGQVYAFSAWEPIPEAITIGVMLLLSTFAVVVSARYFRKRQKWENW